MIRVRCVRYICTWRVRLTLHIGFQMSRVGLCLQFDSIFVAQYTHSLWCDLFDLIRAQPVGGQSIPLARVFPAVTLECLVIYCKVTTRVHTRWMTSNSRTFEGFRWQSSRTFSRIFFSLISDNLDAFMGSESDNTKDKG